ncbi:MAG: hypothetical protein HY360_21310 [Verrucomicrobia bacterium]|nr:hypothetical protein [Verrucomicrobiota bacterium]
MLFLYGQVKYRKRDDGAFSNRGLLPKWLQVDNLRDRKFGYAGIVLGGQRLETGEVQLPAGCREVQFHFQVEKLKPLYFDETDTAKKLSLRRQIDDLIRELTNGKEIFDFEIYFSEVFHGKEGFDVVIQNPPYVQIKGN